MQTVIETSGLCKRFGRCQAVDNLSLSVSKGDVFGFLGPNGAGKSTTIRILAGLVKPDRGSAKIFGHDTWHDKIQAMLPVGALVETPGLYRFLTGRENLLISARMIPGFRVTNSEIDRVLRIVGLYSRADEKVKAYSHGMRQRLALAACLIGNPELLILDEPTTGLDPEGMREVRDLIRILSKERGMTIFLSSHLLHEVQQVCNRVVIISRGKAVLQGDVGELLSNNSTWHLEISDAMKAKEIIVSGGWGSIISEHPGSLLVRLNSENSAALNKTLIESGVDVSEIYRTKMTLEDLYMSLSEKI